MDVIANGLKNAVVICYGGLSYGRNVEEKVKTLGFRTLSYYEDSDLELIKKAIVMHSGVCAIVMVYGSGTKKPVIDTEEIKDMFLVKIKG